MYTKDKNHRLTLRLNDQQHSFVCASAEMLGVSPSDFLRMVINVSMGGAKATDKVMADKENQRIIGEELKRTLDTERSGSGRENDKTDFNDQL